MATAGKISYRARGAFFEVLMAMLALARGVPSTTKMQLYSQRQSLSNNGPDNTLVQNADKVARIESLAMFRMQTTATLSVGLHQDGHGSSGASHILSH